MLAKVGCGQLKPLGGITKLSQSGVAFKTE
jgi:hypothetical protein